jgi:hypothetical protein
MCNSLKILSNVSRQKGLKSDKNTLYVCNTDLILILDPDAIMLAKELDKLPLALTTAGAYLDQVTTSFTDYLYIYKKSWLKLQQTNPEVSSYKDRALYLT